MLLTGCVLPVALVLAVGSIFVLFFMTMAGSLKKSAPEFVQFTELKMCLDKLHSLKQDHRNDGMDQSMEVYISGRFKDLVGNDKVWHNQAYSQHAHARSAAQR